MEITYNPTTFGELKPGDCFYLLTDRFGKDLMGRLFMKTKDCLSGYDGNAEIVSIESGGWNRLGKCEDCDSEPVLKADVEVIVHNPIYF
jgi:hypothetical protein